VRGSLLPVTNKEKGGKWQPLQPKKNNKTPKNNVVCKEGEGGHVRQNKLESESDSFPQSSFLSLFPKKNPLQIKTWEKVQKRQALLFMFFTY
jgi:hypothetical protein